MRGDSKIALAFLAIGFAPTLIKRSKHLSRYVGDQLVRAGEFFLHEDEPVVAEPVEAPPKVEVVEEAVVVPEPEEEVVEAEPVGAEGIEGPTEPVGEAPTDPSPESVTDDKIEGESHQNWD